MPNGDFLVSSSRDKTIKMWEVNTGLVLTYVGVKTIADKFYIMLQIFSYFLINMKFYLILYHFNVFLIVYQKKFSYLCILHGRILFYY